MTTLCFSFPAELSTDLKLQRLHSEIKISLKIDNPVSAAYIIQLLATLAVQCFISAIWSFAVFLCLWSFIYFFL